MKNDSSAATRRKRLWGGPAKSSGLPFPINTIGHTCSQPFLRNHLFAETAGASTPLAAMASASGTSEKRTVYAFGAAHAAVLAK